MRRNCRDVSNRWEGGYKMLRPLASLLTLLTLAALCIADEGHQHHELTEQQLGTVP